MSSELTLSMAKQIADAAITAAKKQNITIVVTIVDQHGNLKHFQRMDNTSYGSIRISQLKAKTSASMPVASADLAARSAKLPANPYAGIPDILLLGGGLPIFNSAKQHIGGIGISGATPELDTLCAQAGLDVYKE